MTESNTPPENQKKKSAFSRFFSRKKTAKTEPENQSGDNSPNSATLESAEEQAPTLIESRSLTQVNNDLESDIQNQDQIKAHSETEHRPNSIAPETETNPPISSDSAVQPTPPQSDPLKTPSTTEGTNASNQEPQPYKESVIIESEPQATADDSTSKETSLNSSVPEDEKSSTDKEHPTTETDAPVATVEQGLNKSRSSFFQKISNVFKGSFNLNDDLFDELEELLITSDIGIDASLNLVEKLRSRVKKEKIQDADGVVIGLRAEISEMLQQSEQEWSFAQKPYVILMVGINGAGKTTTTAKIAKHFQDQGKSVMLAAADTFRAAAVEQLQEWGRRLDIPVVAQAHGSDAAAVAHDALTSAIARNIDVLMIDTAGRLHTQSDLMEQLTKVNRVLAKIDPSTPHEVMQILDAGTGQNALTQLQHFQKAVGVSSICLSKLDGSAKGGIAISLSEQTKLPIRFIGTGEGFNDLQRFSAQQFADALVPSLK